MVYRGKPSKGCQECRQRKIKCDQRPEGCLNCEKKGLRCPGYRDQLDLMFHHETEATHARVKRRASSQASRASSTSATSLKKKHSVQSAPGVTADELLEDWLDRTSEAGPSSAPPEIQYPQPLTYSYIFTPSADERGIGYFYQHYVVHWDQGTGSTSPGRPSAVSAEYLQSGMKALGLAGLSNELHAPELMVEAKKRYVASIQYVNEALKSDTEARKDSTLLTIQLLSVFETVTGCTSRSLEAWRQHVNGAAALLKLRGREQFDTEAGRRLFVQVTVNVMMSCLHKSLPVPTDIEEMIEHLATITESHPGWEFYLFMVKQVNFRAQVNDGTISDPSTIVQTALDLDQAAVDTLTTDDPAWTFETVYTEQGSGYVYEGKYHVYSHFLSATTWNGQRNLRIQLHEIIRKTLLAGFAAQPPIFTERESAIQFQRSTETLLVLQSEILATVPQHLGYPGGKLPSMIASTSDTSIFPAPPIAPQSTPPSKFYWSNFTARNRLGIEATSEPSELPFIRLGGGYMFCWSLFVAGCMDVCTNETRRYIIDTLRNIAMSMGIQRAGVLADILQGLNEQDEEKYFVVPKFKIGNREEEWDC